MKKIFILTGEASGDKLASKVISKLKKDNLNIDYLSVGGESLKALGIKSIYNLKEITYIGFTNVISNIFKINKKINETVKTIIDFIPKAFKFSPPTLKYSISELSFLNSLITFDASLSPDGSPVKINIFFTCTFSKVRPCQIVNKDLRSHVF